ncbi:MAG: hypothetical protein H6722_29840 [Sandaracinus sp.]|nr:hypothetical protein [Myxococcales bacterium]MCB9616659.1 hypothetical protein [Sandaracinus sp.]
MSDSKQHHHVTLVPQPDQIEAARALLVQCAERVSAKRKEGGPLSWCASYDETKRTFYVDALFADEAAVAFHQANIRDLLAGFGAIMAARPETVIRPVFSLV